MGTVVQFLLDHYFLMVAIIIVIIFAIIGYTVESSKKGKEKTESRKVVNDDIPLVDNSINLGPVNEMKSESLGNVNIPSPIELGSNKSIEPSPVELAKK